MSFHGLTLLPVHQYRRDLLAIYRAGLKRVSGEDVVRKHLQRHWLSGPVYLVAIGKAASAMTLGVMASKEIEVPAGLVITKHGYLDKRITGYPQLQCIEANHPIPGVESLQAGQILLDFMHDAPFDARFLFLISGGTSSLVEVLAEGMDVTGLKDINTYLLSHPFDIQQINDIRKQVSRIKGGQLLDALEGREAVQLLISDVPGDDPAVIGSGLLVSSENKVSSPSFPDFIAALTKKVEPFENRYRTQRASIETHIVATLSDAMRAAGDKARSIGHQVTLHTETITGDVVGTASILAHKLSTAMDGVHLWGGEVTVSLPHAPGRGGRNQQFALAAALAIEGADNVLILAGASDGTDGATGDSGGLVDGETVHRGAAAGFDARESLRRADAGRFLEVSGDLITTGPTGTNVMDLIIGFKSRTLIA